MPMLKQRGHHIRICIGCGKEELIRNDVKAERCRACAGVARRRPKPPVKPPVIVNAGERFNLLTVIEEIAERTSRGEKQYLCQCDCGKEKVVPSYALRTGAVRSCGHLVDSMRNISGLSIADDFVGSTNGFLQYLNDLPPRVAGKRKSRMVHVLCRACNTESDMEARNYTRYSSCGCMKSVLRRHHQPAYEGGFACPCCAQTKDESAFHWTVRLNGRRKRASYCKDCTRVKQREAYAKRTGKNNLTTEPDVIKTVQFAEKQEHLPPWMRKEA